MRELPSFAAPALEPGLAGRIEELRLQVREFLAQRLPGVPAQLRAQTWSGADPQFSRAMAERGWIGMVWPKRYGGGERHALERYAVLEEMLAGGAPVGHHWVADRQSGPMILRVGTEEQKASILPRIAAGELRFCIGLSEPGAGSDLAAIRSKAARDGNGWVLNGRKIWTSGAQGAQYMIGLFRTEGTAQDRHQGLSQFLVDMSTPGIEVQPIRTLDGDPHFNEVLFEDVRLPDSALLGAEGGGWAQAMGELAHERAGPERFLSSWPLLEAALAPEAAADGGELPEQVLGEQIAQVAGLRAMSSAVAGMLAAGEDPALHAAMVKELGARFEQALPEELGRHLPLRPHGPEGVCDYQHILAWCQQNAASFSIRGGTREILRGIIARGVGLR